MSVNSLFDLASLQADLTTDDVAFVADPLRGGTFYYRAGWRTYKTNFSFDGRTITDASNQMLTQGFSIGQKITIKGAGVNDGVFTISNVTASTIYTSTSDSVFTMSSAIAEIAINYKPYTATLTFNGGNATISDTVTTGFYEHGFLPGQTVLISSANANYNGVYTIDNFKPDATVATTTVMSVIGKTFPASPANISCTISLQDDGTMFDATARGVGYWRRDFDPKDGLNVTWFGAKGNAFYKSSGNWYSTHDHRVLANDDTASIQRAMDVARGNTLAMAKVVIPPGMFLHSTLYVPTGVLLTGAGAIAESLNTATSKLVMKVGGGDSIRIRETGVTHSNTDRLFWFGGITNLEFYGESTNTSGWAISCRNAAGEEIAPQDMNFFENLQMRNYPQGGIEFPDCAVPLNVRNIKGSFMNGPVIFFGATTIGRVGQSMNFDNVSCDHSTGGGIWLDKLDYKTNIVITNLKSEAGVNTAFPGQPNAQVNAIICTDCTDTPIFVNNANHQNTAIDLGLFVGNPTISISTLDPEDEEPIPCVISFSDKHNLSANDKVIFTTTGTLPASIISLANYYVLNVIDDYSFTISNAPGGEAIDTYGDIQSGVHSIFNNSSHNGSDSALPFKKPGDLISIETYVGQPTISINSPALITLANTFVSGDTVKFYTNGALPANITAGQIYYVLSTDLSSASFKISATKDGDPISTVGSQSGQHRLYKQVNSGNMPRITWVSTTARVRTGSNPDTGNTPLIIAKTGIPYTTTEGGFNVTRELYKDTASIGNGSTINYTDGGTINLNSGSVFNAQDGSFVNYTNGSTVDFESGSETNFKSGSVMNVESGGLVEFESGSKTVFDAGAAGITFYNTTDQDINYDKGFLGYIDNMLQLGTVAGGTKPARAVKLSSTTSTGSTASLTLTRGSGPMFLFETFQSGGTLFSPLFRFKGGLSGSSGIQLISEIATAITQTGSAGYTGLAVNITETTTGSGDKRLIAAQVGGNDKFVVDNGGTVTATGDVKLSTVGKGIYIKEGSNATMGTGTLSAGALTISTGKVTANSRIFLTAQEGTVTNLGMLYIQSRTVGTSFTVKSTNALDTCTFSWLIVEPA